MNKLKKLIEKLGKEDLQLLQKDVESGNIERLIAAKLKKLDKENKECPVCGATVHNGITIQFGPPDLRMTATFDGPDCLQYFTEQTLKRNP